MPLWMRYGSNEEKHHLCRCTLGNITADSTESFSPQCLKEGEKSARSMLDCGHEIIRSKGV
ncbi:MAG: hypothetical protein IKN78_13360 [Bacteroidales bacterium]|nr:hypothetical protein [Bacteroidales bacterium]